MVVIRFLLIFSCLLFSTTSLRIQAEDEPQCFSRFDYDYKMLQKINKLENMCDELKATNIELKATNNELRKEVDALKSSPVRESIYVRWGRPDCPGNETNIVYRGFTTGRHHIQGGGSTILCLPEEPTWGRYMDSTDGYRGNIWGAEIDMDPPSEGKVFDQTVDGLDLPCATCIAPRTITHMFPGRATCFPGWSLEYTGYLMTNYRDRAHNNEYICTDVNPKGVLHGGASDHQNVLYLVEARCGSLPCPPYVEGREVACVVCSK